MDKKVIELNQYIDRVIDRYDQDIDLAQKAFDFSRDAEPGGAVSNDLWSEEIKAWADMLTIESLFYTEDWVFILIDLMAGKISSQPLYVMSRRMVDGKETIDYADAHPLNELIARPNPYQDYHSWMYSVVVQFGLLGNAIQWYSKANNWLIPLRTALTSLEFDTNGSPKNYLYSVESDSDLPDRTRNNVQVYALNEIIHFRRPNPASLVWGLSPFIPGRKSILFNRYSSDYLNAFYLRQATPGMVLEMDRQVNEQQALRQLRSFELAYTGRKNQRRTMLLPKGVKASAMTHTIADQKLLELVNMNRETILNLFRAPKHEFGLQTTGSLGSEEYKIALRNFWEATLIPTCKIIEGGLNLFFKQKLGPNFFLKFDLSGVEALKDDQMKKALLAKEMLAGGLSINEVRADVWEKPAIEGNDYEIPFVAKPATTAAPGFFSLPSPAMAQVPNKDKLKSILASRRHGWHEAATKALDEIVEEKEGKSLFNAALETLVAMAEVAAPIIKRNLKEVKAADIPSKTKLKRDLQKAFDEFEEVWVDEYTKTLSSVVNLGYDQQLDLVFNEQDKTKIEALRARDANRRRLILEERGLDSFANISSTHTDRIMSAITAGVEEKLTVDQIARRIADTFVDPLAMRAKAETIARTETLTAASIGQAAALNNAKEVIPGLKKGWIDAGDDRVRDSHAEVSGEVVDVDDTFSNGLRWPRDTNADDPGEVINCRCTVVMLPPGEDLDI